MTTAQRWPDPDPRENWPLCSRRFWLQRDTDETGVSGTGTVADGVLWPDATVTLRWRGEHRSVVHWSALSDVLAVHGHSGLTRVVWIDTALSGQAPS